MKNILKVGTKAFLKGTKQVYLVILASFHAPGSVLKTAKSMQIQADPEPDPQQW